MTNADILKTLHARLEGLFAWRTVGDAGIVEYSAGGLDRHGDFVVFYLFEDGSDVIVTDLGAGISDAVICGAALTEADVAAIREEAEAAGAELRGEELLMKVNEATTDEALLGFAALLCRIGERAL